MSAASNSSSNNNSSNKAYTGRCSACFGPIPWVEQDPQAHEANGDICGMCGHFYGVPAFMSSLRRPTPNRNALLYDYCERHDWNRAMIRLQYAPGEAYFVGLTRQTPLEIALQSSAPLELIWALVKAAPEVLAAAIWFLAGRPVSEEMAKACKSMLVEKSSTFVGVPEKPYIHLRFSIFMSPLRHANYYDGQFLEACNLCTQTPPQNVLETYTNQFQDGRDKIRVGGLRHALDIWSILLKASYYGTLDEATYEQLPLLHAIAGSREPRVAVTGLTLFVIKLFPEELTKKDKNGNCPLHIAAATVNRDRKEYDDDYDPYRVHPLRLDKHFKHFFLSSFCKHKPWFLRSYATAEEYQKQCRYRCGQDYELRNYKGCDCGMILKGSANDDCSSCKKRYLDIQMAKCRCKEKFEMAKQLQNECKCDEAFEYYSAKMEDEHRTEKQVIIETLAKASPTSASLQNNLGQLPIHVAVGEGKKCWDGGVQELAVACPDGLGMLDPQTKLFPFMAAGARHDLDTTFELLRFQPDVLVNRISIDDKEMA